MGDGLGPGAKLLAVNDPDVARLSCSDELGAERYPQPTWWIPIPLGGVIASGSWPRHK